jgi:hypothetical protein
MTTTEKDSFLFGVYLGVAVAMFLFLAVALVLGR